MPASDQGINKSDYVVVPRTLIFLFNAENDVLLLYGSPTKRLWAGLYNGIGGHIEAGEDIVSAAKRELEEETGINEIEIYLCGQVMVDVNNDAGVAIFIFKGYYDRIQLIPSPEGGLAWIPVSELRDVPVVEDLKVILPRIVSHRPGDPLLIGIYSYNANGNLEISLLP